MTQVSIKRPYRMCGMRCGKVTETNHSIKNNHMKFDYCNKLSDTPRPCCYTQFRQMTEMPHVRELIEKYRAGDAMAKRRLPAFCFHATFGGRPRAVKNATPSGLYILDLDHLPEGKLDELRALWTYQWLEANARYVLLVHVTPSGRGLRLVCRATRSAPFDTCRSIADYQSMAARLLSVGEWLDTVAHDLARLSFCPSKDDIVYLSMRLFTDAPEVTDFADFASSNSSAIPAVQQPIPGIFEQKINASIEGPLQQEYEGLPLAEIFSRYFEQTGGLPVEGGRNARFYTAARDLRYICDFSATVVSKYMPEVGLPSSEVYAVCLSACQSSRASRIPDAVLTAIDSLREETVDVDGEATTDDDDGDASAVDVGIHRSLTLPLLYREIVRLHPAPFREAALLSMLPILGTLATDVRARYLDGDLHSPSFMTMVTAEQASGKSFTRRIVRALLHGLEDEDNAARTTEQAYRQELRRKKNSKQQPDDPRAKVRIVPASISIAKLLQRMDYAEGQHLFSFVEEMDTIIKSNRSGAWSEKNDIYRNAFDNAVYGQDYMSDISYSATLRIYYNLLVLGTPRQTHQFFKNVENGLVSRCCFAFVPDQFGAKMPIFRRLTQTQSAYIDDKVNRLRQFKGEVDLAFVNEQLAEWLEKQRIQSVREGNRARDVFRRRCAVMGFRAVLTIAPLYELSRRKTRDMLCAFALYVADVTLNNLLRFAGTEMNRVLEGAGEEKSRSVEIFGALPQTFSSSDLIALLHRYEMKTPARQILYMWKREGFITKNKETKEYTKNETK